MLKKRIFLKVQPKITRKASTKKNLLEILNSLGNILLFAKIAGIFFFSLNQTTYQVETEDKWKTRIYSLLYLTAYLSAYVLGLKLSVTVDNDTTFFVLVRNGFYVLFCVSTLMQVIIGYCVKSSTARWFNNLATSDSAMEKLGLVINCRCLQKPFAYLISLGIILFITKVAIFQQAFEKPWVIVICIAIYHFIKSTFKMTFVFFMLHLYLRFKTINVAIDEFALGNEEIWHVVSGFSFYDIDASAKLNSICKMHFKLSYLAKRLNDIASFQFFYSFLVSLGALLLWSFYLYHYIKKMSAENLGCSYKSILTLLFGVIGLIDEVIDCILIIKCCRLLCKSANETPSHLHELRNKIQSSDLDEHIKANSLQFLHQKLSFTAQGYFNVNFAVISAMSGTVLTYLVLFIQYDLSFRNREVASKL